MTLSLIRPVCIQDVTPYAPVAAEPCTVGCGLTTGGDSIGTSGVGDAAMAAADGLLDGLDVAMVAATGNLEGAA